ncbi:hypothetical protein RMCBS344292_06935 [Rhizopus microsporus]|nr:hypothetical protein RMCBS344292_06935 [Rhizopus microsporus]
MKLSFSSILCLLLTLFSFLRAFLLYLSSTKDLKLSNLTESWYSSQSTFERNHLDLLSQAFSLGDSPDRLFYFVQISDLHISKFQSKGHTTHFLHFLQSVLPVIRPEFVVVTGDLIDAEDRTRTGSAQYLKEWQVYKAAITEGASDIPWYDIGNNDCFDLLSWQTENDLYETYGRSANLLKEGKGVYSWKVSKEFGEYNFVAADACPIKGPSRPVDFFGYLTANTMDKLASTVISNRYNHTFLFSHYPTTTLSTGTTDDGYGFKDLARYVSAYFCGHLHGFDAGLGDTLKSYDSETDSLELELSDMKDHGSYRIVAVDHDLISFVDVDLPITQIPPITNENKHVPLTEDLEIIWPSSKLRPAPIVLITNPKDARYALPSKEPLKIAQTSTHIRFLVFSEYEHTQLKAKVFVDDMRHPFIAQLTGDNSSLPLWTSSWEPNDFDDFKTHSIRIEVTAPDGQIGVGEVLFRMDRLRINIESGIGEWITWSNILQLLRFLSVFSIVAMLLAILIPKLYLDYESRHLVDAHLRNMLLLYVHEIDCGIYQSIYASVQKTIYIWTHRFLQFSEEQPNTWYMCFTFLISFLTMPWFYAKFIPYGRNNDEGAAYFFLWGLYFPGKQWVPLDTWLYTAFELIFTVNGFILYFIWKSSDQYLFECKGLGQGKNRRTSLCNRPWFQLLVILYLLWRVTDLIELVRWYGGTWSMLTFNLLTWWLVAVAIVLFYGKDGIVSLIKSKQKGEAIGQYLDICQSCCQAIGETARGPFNMRTMYDSNEQHPPLAEYNEGSSSDTSNASITRRNATARDE